MVQNDMKILWQMTQFTYADMRHPVSTCKSFNHGTCIYRYIPRRGRPNRCEGLRKLQTCIMVDAKHLECTWYGEPWDASNMGCPGAMFCKTHSPPQQYRMNYLQKYQDKESNTSKKIAVNTYLVGMWRTLWVNTRCLLRVAYCVGHCTGVVCEALDGANSCSIYLAELAWWPSFSWNSSMYCYHLCTEITAIAWLALMEMLGTMSVLSILGTITWPQWVNPPLAVFAWLQAKPKRSLVLIM